MEFKIEFKGPDWRAIERQVVREANDEVRRRAQNALAGFRCPDHDKPVRFVTEHGSAGMDLEGVGRIDGCCEKALEMADQRIRHALS